MPIGKGGSEQSQSGVHNDSYTGDTSGLNASFSQASPTAGWGSVDAMLRGNLGPTGLNSGQQAATDNLTNYLGSNSDNGLWQEIQGNDKLTPYTTATAHTISAAPMVTAQTGAANMDAYKNPYTNDVVNASLNDLNNAYNKNMVGSGMAAAAGGAFGGGRQAIREAQTTDDYLRNVAGTSANLRDQGFNTAAGYGMQDANRNLSADSTNASNAIDVNKYNSGQLNTADSVSQNAIQSMINNAGNTMNQGLGALQQQYNMAGGGLNNLASYLGTQVPAFGQGSLSANQGSASGTSQGTSSGNSSGKNGGISAG